MAEDAEKRYSKNIIGKIVVSKSGKKYGEVGNIVFETRTGELLQIVVSRPTGYIEGLDLEKDESGKVMMTKVTLRPNVKFSAKKQPTAEQLEKMHHKSHEQCFIANSVKTEVVVELATLDD